MHLDPIARGEAVTISNTIYTTDEGSTPQNIAGWTIRFTVSKRKGSATKMIPTKTCSHTVSANGTLSVDLSAEETNLTPAVYHYDFWRTDAGYERRLTYGDFPIAANARVPTS